MNITIRKLTREMAEDYVRFFDNTPHDDYIDEHKCYCVCWGSYDREGVDFTTAEKRRSLALEYVKSGRIEGYLAYDSDKIVGWCNANIKHDCLKCYSWHNYMGYVPIDDNDSLKIKSVYCFVIAPEMKRRGIASLLLKRVCEDALAEGFDYVEAYPESEISKTSDFGGHLALYEKAGFEIFVQSEQGNVMRRRLG